MTGRAGGDRGSFPRRSTEPNPVLDPLLKPQELDLREIAHAMLQLERRCDCLAGPRCASAWSPCRQRDEAELVHGCRWLSPAAPLAPSVRRNPKDFWLVELGRLKALEKQALNPIPVPDSTRIGSPIARGLRSPIARADSQAVLRLWNETAPAKSRRRDRWARARSSAARCHLGRA